MSGEFNIPTLQQLCVRHFSSDVFPRSLEAALTTLAKLQEIETFDEVKAICVTFLRERAELLHKTYDQSSLERILGVEEVRRQCDQLTETARARRNFSYLTAGTVLDRPKPVVSRSPTEDGFYPFESLQTGMEWPVGVDPVNRERHLSPQEFESVFKMTKESFSKLPHFVRIRTKKEVGLF